MSVIAPSVVLGAFALDWSIGEPPAWFHPVALFGRVVDGLDREWSRPRAAGLVIAAELPLAVGLLGFAATRIALEAAPILGWAVATLAVFSTISLRMLVRVGRETLVETTSDPDAARSSIRALVGRETASLSPAELHSATVESAAENLADGLVAPLLAFAIGSQISLPVGVAGAIWVKAVNTLDSMVGYPDRPHGWASARLDDLVMWLPARVAAVLIAFAGASAGAVRTAVRWAGEPSSPNAGWPMGALAGVLNVGLVKRGAYELNPDAPLPEEDDVAAGLSVVRNAGVLAVACAGVIAWL